MRLEHVTLVQDGITVLDNLNLHIFAGEILGLIFLDDQGKQPLVDMMRRNMPLHYGRVYVQEALANSYQHSPGTKNPVTLIGRKNPLVNRMTVADNVFVLRGGFKKYLMQPAVLNAQFAAFAREAGVQLSGAEYVEDLSIYQRCVVQLLKAVILGHRLIIIQDISNMVSQIDLARFHSLIRHFSQQDISFLYICSHHEETFSICERAAVLENGQVQKNLLARDAAAGSLHYFDKCVLSMEQLRTPPEDAQPGSVLQFDEVKTANLHGVSFGVARGECTILLDASNTALEDVFALLCCHLRPAAGQLLLKNQPYPKFPHQKNFRVGLMPESPAKTMLYPDFSPLENLCFLAGQKQPRLWAGRASRKSIRREYLPLIGQALDAQSIQGLPVAALYSLVYYSQHLFNPHLLVIMQPFFGADMYLRRHILFLINEMRKRGIAVLLLGVNISDSPIVADRMLVMENGRITHEYGKTEMARLNRVKNL